MSQILWRGPKGRSWARSGNLPVRSPGLHQTSVGVEIRLQTGGMTSMCISICGILVSSKNVDNEKLKSMSVAREYCRRKPRGHVKEERRTLQTLRQRRNKECENKENLRGDAVRTWVRDANLPIEGNFS